MTKKCQKSDLKLTSKLILIFVKLQISFTTEKEKKLSEVTLSPDAFFYMEELYLFIGFKKDIYNRIKIYLYICLCCERVFGYRTILGTMNVR